MVAVGELELTVCDEAWVLGRAVEPLRLVRCDMFWMLGLGLMKFLDELYIGVGPRPSFDPACGCNRLGELWFPCSMNGRAGG